MSKILKLIAAAALVALLCCALAACNGANNPADDTTTPDGTTSGQGDNTPGTTTGDIDYTTKKDFNIVKDGSAVCRVVCPEDATPDETALADAIIGSVKRSTGVTLERAVTLGRDDEYEIVIGHGIYDKASEIYDRASYGQWVATSCGNKLIVFATDSASYTGASNQLSRYMGRAEGNSLTLATALMGADTSTAVSVSVPVLRGAGVPAYIQKVGGVDTQKKCTQVAFVSVSEDVYSQYIARLESLGYARVAENEISKNVFTTLVKDNAMLTVDYLPSSRLMRVISEPAYENYIGTLTGGERKGAVKLMQIEDTTHEHPSAFVVTLADGRYFLYDTGFDAGSSATAPQLMEYMRKNNTFTDGKVHIAAIFISHPHPDHMGGLLHLAKDYSSEIVCEAVMYNLVSVEMQSVLSTETLNARQDRINNAAKTLGAAVYCVRAGQKFTLSGTEFNVLFTPDELGNYKLTGKNDKGESDTNYDMNNASVILTMLESGQSVTFMGDCRGGEAAKIKTMYSRGFPGNIMQVAHHGFNVSATLDLYNMARPSVLLWPIRSEDAETTRYFVKQLQAASYVKKHFYENQQVELTLPYTP